MKIKPYLIFNGNAEEAANRYAEILGGRIENLNRYGDCMPDVPQEYKDKIAHICLFVGSEVMGMADAEPNTQTTFGTGRCARQVFRYAAIRVSGILLLTDIGYLL